MTQPFTADTAPLPLFVVRFTAPADATETVDTQLTVLGLDATSWQPADTDTIRYELFTDTQVAAEALAAMLAARLAACGAATSGIETGNLSGVDWREAWKRWFHVERVSRHVIIKPSWESCTPAPDDHVIELDPGMSFGTGQHATTRACIALLDKLASAGVTGTALDIGCGSGILTIAAAKLGFGPVQAIDIDPVAARDTTENLARNRIADGVVVRTGTVADLPPDLVFDVVVANILAPVLITDADAIARHVKPGGHLILSGILATQYASVRAAYAPRLAESDRLTIGEWTTGLYS